MSTMKFMSMSDDPRKLPKIFHFDSSPGRAIGQAIGAGLWDESSYTPELKETLPGGITVYEVKMRRLPSEKAPGPHPLVKVGSIMHTPFSPR